MLTQKKFWVYRNGIDNAKFASAFSGTSTVHGSLLACTDCHGGTDGTAVRATAHAGNGWQRIPGPARCTACHPTASGLAAGSLHTNVKGYEAMLTARGFDLSAGSASRARYDKQCTKCHVANEAGEAACGQCHVAVPDTAGGRLVAGHRFYRTPSTDENCTACHGSRVKDEYYGNNNALYLRNRTYDAALAARDPFAGATIAPDVHKTGGMGCQACHYGPEMHGAGVTAGIDRYGVTGTSACADCHVPVVTAFHSTTHLSAMDCRVCHAQQYKACFSCHTQETALGAGYFSNNETDPTRATRPATAAAWSATVTYAKGAAVSVTGATYTSLQAANLNHAPASTLGTWWQADLPAGDALMTFRVGRNPKFGTEPGARKYAVLRHVPVDGRTFEYTSEGPNLPGLLPNLAALPTWKYATPHNIARVTPITTATAGGSACANCHSSRYADFWLTDPVGDAFGWVPDPALPANAEYQFEVDANIGVLQPAPISPALP